MFTVYYTDDSNKKHITVAKNWAEVRFIKKRFSSVSYEPIPKVASQIKKYF